MLISGHDTIVIGAWITYLVIMSRIMHKHANADKETRVKATLEFSLPEESHEHQTAIDGGKWMGLLHDIDESLRGEAKHGTDKRYRASEVRTMIHNAMAEYGLSFD